MDTATRSVVLHLESGVTRPTARAKLRGYQRAGLTGPALRRALEVLAFGDAYSLRSDAFQGDDGSVAVAFYQQDRCVEVVIEVNGDMVLFVEKGVGFTYEVEEVLEPASLSEVAERLQMLSGGEAWNSSGSLSRVIGTESGSGFQTLLSSDLREITPTRRTEKGVSLYSNLRVPAANLFVLSVSVTTLDSITASSSEVLSSTGDLNSLIYSKRFRI
jgi:hypothetical protein